MRLRLVLAAVLCAVTTVAYLVNGRSMGSGDTIPAEHLPFSILGEGDFDLDEFERVHGPAAARTYPTQEAIPYYLRRRGGHVYSAYTPGPAILALPIYAIPYLAGVEAGTPAARDLSKYAATAIVVVSVLLLFFALARPIRPWWAFWISAVYGLGTSALSISAQALWQHGPSQLCLSLMLLFLVRVEEDDRNLIPASFALSCAVVMRSTNLLLGLPLGIWMLARHRRGLLPWVALAFAPPVGLLAAYYLAVFGTLGPSFEHIEMGLLTGFRQIPLHEGLYGSLLSPARGLFFYSPVLLFSIAGAVVAVVRRDWLTVAVGAGAALVTAVAAKWFTWWGGHCWGPRLLADVTPLACFLMHPLADTLARRWYAAAPFFLAAALSVGIHLLGAFAHDGRWDAHARTDRVYENMLACNTGPVGYYVGRLLHERGLIDEPGPQFPRGGRDRQGSGAIRRTWADLVRRDRRSTPVRALCEAPVEEDGYYPGLGISTDEETYRVGETLRLELEFVNPRRPRAQSAHIFLRRPDGSFLVFDGRDLEPWRRGPITAWSRNCPTPHTVHARFEIPLDGWDSGRYTWYLVLTDPPVRRIEGRVFADFAVDR